MWAEVGCVQVGGSGSLRRARLVRSVCVRERRGDWVPLRLGGDAVPVSDGVRVVELLVPAPRAVAELEERAWSTGGGESEGGGEGAGGRDASSACVSSRRREAPPRTKVWGAC